MKARTWLALAVAASAALLQGCELALIGASAGAAYSTLEDRRSSGTQLDDDAIELRAGSRVADRFADKVHVNVAAFNRATLITGEAPDEAVRAEVEKIVQGVPNVRGVTNELQLAPITSLGERTNDSLITAQVKARYLRAKAFNPVHVKVCRLRRRPTNPRSAHRANSSAGARSCPGRWSSPMACSTSCIAAMSSISLARARSARRCWSR